MNALPSSGRLSAQCPRPAVERGRYTARASLAVLVLAAVGCRCEPPTMALKPDYVATPVALNFSACPTKDEMNMPVADVFPDEQKVNISNKGKAGGTFTATLSGDGAAQFKLDPMRTPMSVSPGEDQQLPIQFSPVKKGDVRATLTIDDGEESTTPLTVDLVGTAKNLPAQPTIEAAIESYAQPGDFSQLCPGSGTVADCIQAFPDTLLGDTTTLKVKLRNKGCPALKITSLDLAKLPGGSDDAAFFLDQPGTLPSAATPLVMSSADGTAEITMIIRFSPQAEPQMIQQRLSTLTIKSNDPVNPTLVLQFEGNGVAPDLYAVPTFCNFNDPNDRCRVTGAKVANEAVFEINNGGSAPLTIDSVKFASSGSSTMGAGGRFTITTPISGMMIPGNGKVNLTVTHMDQPLFVIDQIVVTGSPATAGKVTLTVAGDTAPCLETDPDSLLDFGDPTSELTVKPVTVKALAMRPGTSTPCGDLIVDGADIATNSWFSAVAPFLDAGTRIPAGQQAQVNVQYKKPVTGGSQAWDMTIRTNDLDYAAPAYKKILLQSKASLNQIPVCVLKACTAAMTDCSTMGSLNGMTVSLQALPTPKNIILYGGDSNDPGNPMQPGIAQWKFAVIPPSVNVTDYMLTSAGMFTAQNYQTLTLSPSATGLYKAFLYVKDDTGLQSAQACEFRLTVNQ